MIPAKPTYRGRLFWNTFVRISMKLAFKEVVIEGDPGTSNRAVVLIGNHISWWDGFFALYLNLQVFKKEYYVMMLETELRKHRFMRQGGAFSIDPGSRSIVNTFAYTHQLLAEPQNLVTIFPQGKIHSQYDPALSFQPGIGKMLDRTEEEFQVIFYSAHLDYGSHARPTLSLRLKQFSIEDGTYVDQLEEAYHKHLTDALSTQISLFPI